MRTSTARITPVLTTARAIPRAGWGLTSALAATAVCAGILPIAQMIAVGIVVGAVPRAVQDGAGSEASHRVLITIGVLGALYFTAQVVPPLQWSLSRVVALRLEHRVTAELMRAGADPVGIDHLESEAFSAAASAVREIRSGAFALTDAVNSVAQLLGGRLQGIAAAAILASFHWWAPLVLLVTFLPWDAYFRGEHRAIARSWAGRSTEQQRADHFRRLAFDPVAGREIRVFGLTGFVLDRFDRHFRTGIAQAWKERGDRLRRLVPCVLLVVLGYLLVYGAIGHDLASGAVTLTAAVVFVQVSGQIWRVVPSFNDLSRTAIGSASLTAVGKLAPAPLAARRSSPAPGDPVRFEGVSFRYPGQDELVLDGLDLVLHPGRSLAVVGDNGAGKSTLIALLAGLRHPASGRVTAGGIDLRDVDENAWRARLSAVFQDFVHYPWSARDNIAVGAKSPLTDEQLWEVARASGAAEALDGLPRGLDTPLSKDFDGGAELSGGQWQRIALARALAGARTGADLLILDEPTSNLDVRAEAEVFERFLGATRGTTTVLVSHRFTNVRRADRIVVLDGGRITEDGTHDELMAANGHYARMFRLQAERFAEQAPGGVDA